MVIKQEVAWVRNSGFGGYGSTSLKFQRSLRQEDCQSELHSEFHVWLHSMTLFQKSQKEGRKSGRNYKSILDSSSFFVLLILMTLSKSV